MKSIIIITLFLFVCLKSKSQPFWNTIKNGNNEFFHDVEFVNDSVGYVCGELGHLYKTIDRGSSWVLLNTNSADNLYSLSFPTEKNGYVTNYIGNGILRTNDGGVSWSAVKIQINPSNLPATIGCYFISIETGFVCGSNGFIGKTVDSGKTWSVLNSGVSHNLNCTYFINSLTGFVVGNGGTILKTTDGGNSWTKQNSNTSQNLNAVRFYNSQVGHCVGDDGTILKTTDSGSTWVKQNSGSFSRMDDVYFVTQQIGHIVGVGRFYTTDGGNTWVDYASNNPSQLVNISCIEFIDTITGYGAGADIYKTTGSTSVSSQNIEGISAKVYPNPSSLHSTIEYTLPIGATNGIIDFYNMNGQKVKSYTVDNTFNSLLIDNNELNSGTYYYYLTANGERSKTKKMVVVK